MLDDVDLTASGDWPERARRRGARDRRLHVRDDRPAQGRRAAAPRARDEPRRARRRVGVDRRRRRRPRAPALPRARPDPRHARPAAARRRRLPPRQVLDRGGRAKRCPAARRCCSASRRCTTGWRPTSRKRRRWRKRSARRGCSSPAPPRCPPPTTSGSRRATGLKPVERYGMSETLMNTAIRADGDRRAGTVGVPLPGVEVRLVDDDGNEMDVSDDETVGEIQVRGPNLFLEYLNRPDATEEAMKRRLVRHRRRRHPLRGRLHPDRRPPRDRPDQERRLQDRRRRDRERAARAPRGGRGGRHRRARSGPRRADHRLDRRRGRSDRPGEKELADHVARLLTPHKRPREVRYLDALPRNAMGKVTKKTLRA